MHKSVTRKFDATMAQPRYRLRGVIGRGAFALVIKCSVDSGPLAGKELALKVLLPDADASAEQCFRSEADVLSRFTRNGAQGLVACYGLATLPAGLKGLPKQYQGRAALAMVLELMECGSLARMVVKHMSAPIRRPRYTKQEALQLLMDIALALQAMHTENQPLLHRDLKLGNVLLTRRYGRLQAKLADLGLHVCLDRSIHKPILRRRASNADSLFIEGNVCQDTLTSDMQVALSATGHHQAQQPQQSRQKNCTDPSTLLPTAIPGCDAEIEPGSHGVLPSAVQAKPRPVHTGPSGLYAAEICDSKPAVTPPASADCVHASHTWSAVLPLRSLSTHWPPTDNDHAARCRSMEHTDTTNTSCFECQLPVPPYVNHKLHHSIVTAQGSNAEIEDMAAAATAETPENGWLEEVQHTHVSLQRISSAKTKSCSEAVRLQELQTRQILPTHTNMAPLHSYKINNVLFEASPIGIDLSGHSDSGSSAKVPGNGSVGTVTAVAAQDIVMQSGMVESTTNPLHASYMLRILPGSVQAVTETEPMPTSPFKAPDLLHNGIVVAQGNVGVQIDQCHTVDECVCKPLSLAAMQAASKEDATHQGDDTLSEIQPVNNALADAQPRKALDNTHSIHNFRSMAAQQHEFCVPRDDLIHPIASDPLPFETAHDTPRHQTAWETGEGKAVAKRSYRHQWSLPDGSSTPAFLNANKQAANTMLAMGPVASWDNHNDGASSKVCGVKQQLSSLRRWAGTDGPFIPKLFNQPSNFEKRVPTDLAESAWVFNLTAETGSCMYMAPEIYKKEPYNQAADVHSFGVVAYEVLTRSLLVFTHVGVGRTADTPEGFTKAVSEGYRPARPACMSDGEWSLVTRCWAADPLDRPPIQDVVKMLTTLLQESPEDYADRQTGCSCFRI